MQNPADSSSLSYRPSVFYFRKDLRESPTCEAAALIAADVCSEFERLRDWAAEQGILPASNVHVAAEMLRSAIHQSTSHAQVIVLGLFVCHELEEVKRFIREAGRIPPRWSAMPREVEEKGLRIDALKASGGP